MALRFTHCIVIKKNAEKKANSEIKTLHNLTFHHKEAIFGEEITLYMINPKAPCFIRDKDETYIYLILPVNFNA